MVIFARSSSAKSIDSASPSARIEILDRVPVDTIWPGGNVVEIGVANQRAQVALVERKLSLRRGVLLWCPFRRVLHDAGPTHHAAAQHISEVLNPRRRNFHHVILQHCRW